MTAFYKRSPLGFAITWIVVYVVGSSIAESLWLILRVYKLATAVFHLALTVVLLRFIFKNGEQREYGLCLPTVAAKRVWYYLPLILMSTVNLWFGIRLNDAPFETVSYMVSMACVGVLEELIFRGLLFRAMCRDNVRAAIVVSSVTFGIGHIVNLFSGAQLLPTLCQIAYATAFGFLFVILFYRGKSLIPCILAHSFVNVTDTIMDQTGETNTRTIVVSLILCAVATGYALILNKRLKDE